MALIRSLRWMLLLGLVALVGGIMFSLTANARINPREAPDELAVARPSVNGIAQKASRVEIVRTRSGSPTLRMRASESTTYTNGHLTLTDATFRIFASPGKETLVEAPLAEMTPFVEDATARAAPRGKPAAGGDEGVGSWMLSGGVKVTAADGISLAMPTLSYDESLGQARTSDPVSFTRGTAAGSAIGMIYDVTAQTIQFQQHVLASMPLGSMGTVKVEAATARHDMTARTFEMNGYRAVTERGETLSGTRLVALFHEGTGLDRLEGDQGFVLESTHAVPTLGQPASPLAGLLALEGSRTMRGQRLAMVFNGAPEPVSLEVSGDANLTASDVNGSGEPSSIDAETLTFDLNHGNLSRAHATGSVDLKGAPVEGQSRGFRLRSDALEAAFDPNLGLIRNLEGMGKILLTDQDLESQGNRTVLDPNSDIVTLTGDEGKPATATWLGRKVQAQRIEADRKRKTLAARGGVRASYQPAATATATDAKEGQSLPFFRGGETVYAMAGSLTFADQGKLAHYRDHVRLWQGDNRVEASEVDLNESAGTLEARVDVISTFRQPPAGDAPAQPAVAHSPSDDIVTVAAAVMKFDRSTNIIVYSGHVQVTQGGMRVTSDVVTVTLVPGGGSAEKMEATGAVETREQDRIGRGDRLIADLKANTLRLSGNGREATVQDESGQQVVRGSTLTMDRT
ncbi:MAG TPA: LptA/OstA family protein, partial [Patescibacteria group bacterium]|nr:LptA/OstA family protein [Patescibacteria group bacterium]